MGLAKVPMCDVLMADAFGVAVGAEYCWFTEEEACPDDDKMPRGAGYGLFEASIAISPHEA